MQLVLSYVYALVALIALDLLWLGVIAKRLYVEQLGNIMSDPIRIWPAVLFYVLFAFGLLVFVVAPALSQNSFMHAVLYGALFGFMAYMTYELVNASVIRDWPLLLIPVDIVWGTILGAVVSAISFLAGM